MVDAVIVGSGPNGLAAAVTLARAGLSVQVFERNPTIGGGARTEELTLPGFRHDVCSAVHPMALASEFFQRFELDRRVQLRHPPAAFGHPLDGGRAGVAYRDIERTVESLGIDGPAYAKLMGPMARNADEVAAFTGSQLLRIPRHPLTTFRFGLRALEQGTPLWNARFNDVIAPAMITGVAAHAILPMPSLATAGSALSLGAYAHARGWPIPVGGSQSITAALADDLLQHGGHITTNTTISNLNELPAAKAIFFDTTPSALADIAGERLPHQYVAALKRFRYGNGVAKIDFALSAPVPWSNDDLRGAGTVHVGGTRAEIAASERAINRGQHHPFPFVLASEPTIVDPGRAPQGGHILWTYCHVPSGSTQDQTDTVIRQIERFAPGFRDTILASASHTAAEMQQYNPNYVGGDIAAGAATLRQLIKRPTLTSDPWRTPTDGLYLCSSSTPPGPGVHGLAGWNAARSALRHTFHLPDSPDLTYTPAPSE